jgi:hypothetical protein
MAATGWNISKLNTRPRLDCCTLFLHFCVYVLFVYQKKGNPPKHLFEGSELFSKVFIVLNNSENIKNGQFFYFVTTCKVHALMMKRENNE